MKPMSVEQTSKLMEHVRKIWSKKSLKEDINTNYSMTHDYRGDDDVYKETNQSFMPFAKKIEALAQSQYAKTGKANGSVNDESRFIKIHNDVSANDLKVYGTRNDNYSLLLNNGIFIYVGLGDEKGIVVFPENITYYIDSYNKVLKVENVIEFIKKFFSR